MNTSQINEFMKKFLKHKCFLGVFPCDMLPAIKDKPCSLIANTDPSDKSGVHWVGIIFHRDGSGEFFNSFVLPPLERQFIDFLNKNASLMWTYNAVCIQNPTPSSITCGQFCILYITLRCYGYEHCNIVGLFSKKLHENDQLVKSLLKNIQQFM